MLVICQMVTSIPKDWISFTQPHYFRASSANVWIAQLLWKMALFCTFQNQQSSCWPSLMDIQNIYCISRMFVSWPFLQYFYEYYVLYNIHMSTVFLQLNPHLTIVILWIPTFVCLVSVCRRYFLSSIVNLYCEFSS